MLDQQAQDKRLKAYKLSFPRDLDVERVNAWLHTVSGTLQPRHRFLPRALQSVPTMVFETWSQPTGITWRLLVPWEYASITTQLANTVPGIAITPDDEYPRRRWSRVDEIGVRGTGRQFYLGNPSDVATAILTAMSAVQTDEALVMQWVVTPAPREPLPIQGEARSDTLTIKGMASGRRVANNDEVNTRRDKLKEPNYQAVLRVASYAQTKPRSNELISGLRTALVSREAAGIKFTKRFGSAKELQLRVDNASAPALAFPAQLSATELSSFIGWRLANVDVPGLPALVARQIHPVEDVLRAGRRLGMSNYPGRERSVALSFKDALTHQWVCGSTGSGKTTMLANMVKDDITAGHGLLLIEAKGDLFTQTLDYIPEKRERDVIVIDLNNAHRAIGLNFLDQGQGDHVIDGITAMFDGMYATKGVWSKAVFYNGLKVLMNAKRKYALTDLGPLLMPQTDAQLAWAKKVVSECPDTDIREWMQALYDKPEGKRQQIVQPVIDRVWEFNKPKLKLVLGQADSSFQFTDAVRDNKIILVNLAGVEKNTSDLIGALIFNEYWRAVQQVRTPPRPNFCYMDEFQSFVGAQADFNEVLAKARSFQWGLVMANQYVTQLPTPLQDALMRNAKTKIIFNAAGDEARRFESEFAPTITRDDIATLGSYTAVAKVAQNGSVLPPFTMKTNAPEKPSGNSARVRGESLAKYGRDSADVEQDIQERRQTETATTNKGDDRFRFADDWTG